MRIGTCAAFAAILAVVVAPAWSQTERSGNADARVMQQLQQVSSERASLQAENARLKQELEQAKKDLTAATSGRSALENRARVLSANAEREQASVKQAEEQTERVRGQMQELIAKFRETAQNLRQVEVDRANIQSSLAVKEREYKVCVDRNAALYNLNAEVLDRMDNRGVWSALTEREPFTKIKRIELENLIDDYKYRADELRLEQSQQAKAAQEAKN